MVGQTKDSSQIFHLLVTWRCDGKCPGCIYSKQLHKKDQDMSKKTEQAVVKKIGQYHLVSMAGGEPTIHPRFWQMVKGILAKNPVSLEIVTNGLNFSKTQASAKRWFSTMNRLAQKPKTLISIIMSVGDLHANGLKGDQKELRQRIENVKSALPKKRGFGFDFFVELVPKQTKRAAIRKYRLPKETHAAKWQTIPKGGTVPETVIDPHGNVFATEAALLKGKKPLGNIRKSMSALQRRRRGPR